MAVNRLGPFETFAEAAQAEKLILDRARRLREEEARDWDDD